MLFAAATEQRARKEIFLARYGRLLKWAVQIANPDRALAEDILHEAFVQFTLSGPALVTIQDADHYLYGVLRNLHLSHLRRAVRQRLEQLPGVEHDLVEEGLWALDPRNRIQACDELRLVCRYACLRKETSISGSVLLLRFFHGYFPSEVAKLSHSSRNAVNVRLKSARSEVQAYFAATGLSALVVGEDLPPGQSPGESDRRPALDIFSELRREIFAARHSECFAPGQLPSIYQTGEAGVTRAALSHLVSCALCLDEANRLLGLPTLRERHPIDVLGAERDRDKDLVNPNESSRVVGFRRRARGASPHLQSKRNSDAEPAGDKPGTNAHAAAC